MTEVLNKLSLAPNNVQLWKQLGSWLQEDSGASLDEASQTILISMLVDRVSTYPNRKCDVQVHRVLSLLCTPSRANSGAFAGSLVQTLKDSGTSGTPSAQLRHIKYFCDAARSHVDVPACTVLVRALLDRSRVASNVLLSTCRRLIAAIPESHHEAIVNTAVASKETGDVMLALCAPASRWLSHAPELLQTYQQKFICSPTVIDERFHRAWAPLLASSQVDSSVLFPHMQKFIRRSAEVSMENIRYAIEMLNEKDAEKCLQELLADVLKLTAASKPTIRNHTKHAMRAFAKKCSNFNLVIEKFPEVIQGIRVAEQVEASVHTMCSCLEVVPDRLSADLGDAAAQMFLKLFKSQSKMDVRIALLKGLGQSLAVCNTVPSEAASFIVKGLADSKPQLRAAHVHSLFQALSTKAAYFQETPVAKALSSGAAQKASQLLFLPCLLRMGADDVAKICKGAMADVTEKPAIDVLCAVETLLETNNSEFDFNAAAQGLVHFACSEEEQWAVQEDARRISRKFAHRSAEFAGLLLNHLLTQPESEAQRRASFTAVCDTLSTERHVDLAKLLHHSWSQVAKTLKVRDSTTLGNGLVVAGAQDPRVASALTQLDAAEASAAIEALQELAKSFEIPSAEHVEIYNLEYGQLFNPPDFGYIPEVVTKKKDSNDEWADSVRRDIAKSRDGDAGQEKVTGGPRQHLSQVQQKEWDAQADKEAEIRKQVDSLVKQGNALLAAVESLSSVCRGNVGPLLDLGMRCLSCSLFANRAIDALEAVMASAFSSGEALELRVLLWWLYGTKDNVQVSQELIAQSLEQVLLRYSEAPLDTAAFSCLFPLIKSVLQMDSLDAKRHAFAVVKAHAPLKVGRRGEMAAVLVEIYQSLPPVQAASVLDTLATLMHTQMSGSDLVIALDAMQHAADPECRAALAAVFAKNANAICKEIPEDSFSMLFLSQFDEDETSANLMSALWKSSELSVRPDFSRTMLAYLDDTRVPAFQERAARALAQAARVVGSDACKQLSVDLNTLVIDRRLAGVAFTSLAEVMAVDVAEASLRYIIDGKEILLDDEKIRSAWVNAGVTILNIHGATLMDKLFTQFEDEMQRATLDQKRRALAILLASLSSHLNSGDPRLGKIMDLLLKEITNSTDSVQRSIADRMVQLAPKLDDTTTDNYMSQIIKVIQNSKKKPESRGMSWALSGIIRGRKLPCVKKFEVISRLDSLMKNKKRIHAREGAFVTVQCLVQFYGQLFECYFNHLLGRLLDAYSDKNAAVRTAAASCARVIMANLSAYGVRLVLPGLLKSIRADSWRKKKGGIELLGSMAFLKPRQLSQCLPTIVPVLIEILTDTHVKVQEAARESLELIGKVISNPELRAHVPLMLRALKQPERYIKSLLQALQDTKFVHMIDAASLSLLMPCIQHGLNDRSAEVKQMAVTIVGNVGQLTTGKDIQPYLDKLTEKMLDLLDDARPDMRTLTAKAWANLINGFGQAYFPTILQDMLKKLKHKESHTARIGAAEALAEILRVLGDSHLEKVMPELLARTESNKSVAVRQGAITAFQHLSVSVGDSLLPWLSRIIAAVLRGLADEDDSITKGALEAGHFIVGEYAITGMAVLLPEFLDSCFSVEWRVRQSALRLLGEMLFSITGTTGKNVITGEAEETLGTETNEEALLQILGEERRNKVMAMVYLCRADDHIKVQTQAMKVWKSVVYHTPRMLRFIMPTLVMIIIECLGSHNSEKRELGGTTLAELVTKLGERVIAAVMPAVRNSLGSEDESVRIGGCFGASQLVSSASKNQIASYLDELLGSIIIALRDESNEVRLAAADAFNQIVDAGATGGTKVISRAIRKLVTAIEEGNDNARLGLQSLVAVRRKTFTVVVDQLVEKKMPGWACQVLSDIASAHPKSLVKQVKVLFPLLLDATARQVDFASEAALKLLIVVGKAGSFVVFDQLISMIQSVEPATRQSVANLLCGYFSGFCKENGEDEDVDDFRIRIFPALLSMFADDDDGVRVAAVKSCGALLKSVPKGLKRSYVIVLRESLAELRGGTSSFCRRKCAVLAGFAVKGALTPFFPVLREGLTSTHSSPQTRQAAALAVGELGSMIPQDALTTTIALQLTGPLLRVLGERLPPFVKASILQAINSLFDQFGKLLKTFVSQFQTAFVKALHDPDSSVRAQAALAIGRLTTLNLKVAPMITSFCANILSSDKDIRESNLDAMANLLKRTTSSVSEDVCEKVESVCNELLQDGKANESVATRRICGQLQGLICRSKHCDFPRIINNAIARADSPSDALVCSGYLECVGAILHHARPKLVAEHNDTLLAILSAHVQHADVSVRVSALRCLYRALQFNVEACPDNLPEITRTTLLVLNRQDTRDDRVTALKLLKRYVAEMPPSAEIIALIVEPAFALARDRSSFPIKYSAERLMVALLTASNLDAALASLDSETSKLVRRYKAKVLKRLQDDDSEEVSIE